MACDDVRGPAFSTAAKNAGVLVLGGKKTTFRQKPSYDADG